MRNITISKEFAITVAVILGLWFLGPHILFSAGEKSIEKEEKNYHKQLRDHQDKVIASIGSLTITDANLLACIQSAVHDRAKIPPTNSGSINDVRELTVLFCPQYKIVSLHGIEQLQALEFFDVSYNDIKDLSPLTAIASLRSLNISSNPISDIQSLKKLTGLIDISLPRLPEMQCSEIRKIIGNARTDMNSTDCDDNSNKTAADTNDSWREQTSNIRDDSNRLTPHQEAELMEYERNSRRRYE